MAAKSNCDSRDSYLPLAKVADRWGCCHSTVLSLVRNGDLQAFNISTGVGTRARYVVPLDAVLDFEARRTVVPPTPKQKRRAKVQRSDVIEFFK